ncbi:MAG TPA: S1-like domain-containing RNA-binding protein [Phnomibacter sp.]|nr:S1-like domain-containing RNA-binding protein [Phnomibacter sp.]
MKIEIGTYNELPVLREVAFGMYLDDGKEGILLPKRFIPDGLKVGDSIRVFIYHDGEGRLIATTQTPKAGVGDFARLKVVDMNRQGAFLDNGLMKDLFVPNSKMRDRMKVGGEYLVYVYLDLETRRLTATEKFDHALSNDNLTVEEKEKVQLVVYRRTDIGYVVIINGKHTGVLHFSDIFQTIRVGDRLQGYVKKIYDDNRIDVAIGDRGYGRVEGESDKILRMLNDAGGFLPYHDKSDPEEIYEVFGMSKKAFKMAVGHLFRARKIQIEDKGIRVIV